MSHRSIPGFQYFANTISNSSLFILEINETKLPIYVIVDECDHDLRWQGLDDGHQFETLLRIVVELIECIDGLFTKLVARLSYFATLNRTLRQQRLKERLDLWRYQYRIPELSHSQIVYRNLALAVGRQR